MPTQNIIKKLKGVFVTSPKANDKVISAIKIAKGIVNIEQHKKKILTEVQWLISEAHSKYTTQYRTSGALRDCNIKE